MKELLKQWLETKEQEKKLKELREEIEIQLYEFVQSELPADGSKTIYADEYKLVIKPNYSVKVDQDMAPEYGQYFKVKYDMSWSQYKQLDMGARHYVDNIVTISTLKPSFSVEVK